jgi:hypothetical protein
MTHNQSDLIDEIHEVVMEKEWIEATEKTLNESLDVASYIEGHDTQLQQVQLAAGLLDIVKKMANGEAISQEELKLVDIMDEDTEKPDERKEVSLPDCFFVHASTILDLTPEELSWKNLYIRSLLCDNVSTVYDETKKNGAMKRRDFAVEQLDALKIPYVLRGENNRQLDVLNEVQVCKQQRALADVLEEVFLHALDVQLGKTTERSIVSYLTQDEVSIKTLEKLGYLVDTNRDRTIITM